MTRLTQDLQRWKPITMVRNQHCIFWEPLAAQCPITTVPAEESWQFLREARCIEELVFVGFFGASSSRGNMYLIPQYARCLFRMQHRELTNDSENAVRNSARFREYQPKCMPPRPLNRHKASRYLQQLASEVEPPWQPLFCSLRTSSNS